MWQSLIDFPTLRLLAIIASALTLASLMEEKGMLARLANTMGSIAPKPAMHLIPAFIGLVPMPAGAVVSATAVQGLVKRLKLLPEQGTFINYWFRHIWEFSMPVYPAIITTSAIMAIPLLSAVRIFSPMTALAVILGGILSYFMLKKAPKLEGNPAENVALSLLKASWPILLLVPMVLFGLDAIIAFPLTLLLLAGQQRAKWPELRKALKYGLTPKVLFLLYSIMLYKATIETSGAANILVSDMQSIGFPSVVMLSALPFIMGLATGFSMAFVGVALPLLVPYIVFNSEVNSFALLLAYTSGMMGVLLSPLHLCLILSAEFFKASLARVYKYLLPICAIIEATVIVIFQIAG
jgi:integral membrane protein (TIGR00529 family)